MLTAERARTLLEYDVESGLLMWKESRGRVSAGSFAGRVGVKGYVVVHVDGRAYHAHRVVWLIVHGRFPPEHIDHIDGDRANNRLTNLREASNAENQQNLRKARAHNKTGTLGVSMHKGHWRAQIVVNGKAKHLGHFATKAEAAAAYLIAKRRFHPMGRL
jgi:hypothetical protein